MEAGELGIELPDEAEGEQGEAQPLTARSLLPEYLSELKDNLEAILAKSNLRLWLMIDRLDEIFLRRSSVERLALRGLLKAIRAFNSERIKVKVFLRDDILSEVVRGHEGFTALTHLTDRQSQTLSWTEDQILTVIVKRLLAQRPLRDYLDLDKDALQAPDSLKKAFYTVFPGRVEQKRRPTLSWIYTRTTDGRQVVTPRDVIYLLTRAKQWQLDDFNQNPAGQVEWIIGPKAILHGLAELSKWKKETLMKAEYPHLWSSISKFEHGKTEYSGSAIERLLGVKWQTEVEDLVSVGLLTQSSRNKTKIYVIPYVYRSGLNLKPGRVD